ncbi:MAG: peptidase [Caulobacter sp.]|nr:peptidase [Caulobacter sp.]
MRAALAAAILIAGGLLSLGAAPAAPPIVLESPIGCRVGEVCQIQQYFDHDPGPGAKDYRCGGETYEGHDGTDIRVPDLAAVRRGIPVVAAAAGTVRGGRDGMDDVNVAKIGGRPAVANRECGNGVVIVHPGGWETQYCHMRKGSVLVKPGQAVTTGQPLGMVGMSGDAEFPHVHLSVRHGAEKIDPFAYGAAPGACGTGASLWSKSAQAQLAYRSPALLNAGFATGGVSTDDVEAAAIPPPSRQSAGLVAYVRAIGLKQGDIAVLRLTGPNGAELGVSTSAPMNRDKAQWLMFAGKKRPAEGWPAGRYHAVFEVRRQAKVVLTRAFDLTL